ncbi:MAG: iron chelate uptake ABC transporter family permease subunit [Actinobacteria bacterium]|nr:iron chelate uptake ABC transporter family permease subunit [Actinomycetota bacterium]
MPNQTRRRNTGSPSAPAVIGRPVLAPTERAVGVITALVGAPYLLWLLARATAWAATADSAR